MCLLGSNGSGKTTLLNLITGITSLEKGDAKLILNDSEISLKENL